MLRQVHDNGDGSSGGDEKVDALLLAAPTIAGESRTARRHTRRRVKKRRADGSIDECLVAFHSTNTIAVEQYRKLYAEIIRAEGVRELRTLLVVSALRNEGKTITALNLAITMAASGTDHALLVEMDFREPSVQDKLGTHPAYGLTDYLLGDVEFEQIFNYTSIPGLTVVHAGRPVKDPIALLSPQKMGHFFQQLKSQTQYRYIVLDSSPILATSEPAILMTQYVDAALLVVQASKTPRELVAEAIETLGPEHVLGCVFNGIIASDTYYDHYQYKLKHR